MRAARRALPFGLADSPPFALPIPPLLKTQNSGLEDAEIELADPKDQEDLRSYFNAAKPEAKQEQVFSEDDEGEEPPQAGQESTERRVSTSACLAEVVPSAASRRVLNSRFCPVHAHSLA